MADARDATYTILLVDDNAELLEILADLLEATGTFTVHTAVNGVEALERFIAVQPHCVVIDVKMPELDGYQLVRALRGDPDTASTPLIMLSALNQDKDKLVGQMSGADQYLTKPITPTELIEAIHRSLALSEAERAQQMRRLADDASSG